MYMLLINSTKIAEGNTVEELLSQARDIYGPKNLQAWKDQQAFHIYPIEEEIPKHLYYDTIIPTEKIRTINA